MKKEIICGIYKITSPIGKVYIGQSVNIYKRWGCYLRLNNCKGQPRLFRSFIKHSPVNHVIEIIQVCVTSELDTYERYWQEFYNSTGKMGLNCFLQQTIEKPRKINYYKTIKKLSAINKGRKHSPESKQKMSLLRSGVNHHLFGKHHSDETKNKIANSHKGKKLSDDHKEKLRVFGKSQPPIFLGKTHTNISKKKIGEASKLWKRSDKTKLKMSENHGRKLQVMNKVTGVAYPSIKTAAISEKISVSTLTGWLNGRYKNKSNIVYA